MDLLVSGEYRRDWHLDALQWILGPVPMTLNRDHQQTDFIHGDRRRDRRYTISMELRYKVTRGKQVLEMGTGRTLDISSGGIAFTTDQPLPVGMMAELWVNWPVPLNGQPLRLVVLGRIVRNGRRGTAIQSVRHEFRMAGGLQMVAPTHDAVVDRPLYQLRSGHQ